MMLLLLLLKDVDLQACELLRPRPTSPGLLESKAQGHLGATLGLLGRLRGHWIGFHLLRRLKEQVWLCSGFLAAQGHPH